MFRLVRFFLLTSVIAAAMGTAAVVMYRQYEVERLIAMAESQNVALAQSFANTIWPRFSGYLRSAGDLDGHALQARAETRDLHETVKALSAGLPTLKVKIYNVEGLTVFSSDATEIGEDKSTNLGFFSAAREGKPLSQLSYRDKLSSFEGAVQDRDVVESYLPIRQGDGPVEGVFELYTDVTPLVAGVRRSTTNLVVGYALFFALLYGTLFFIVHRADRTIKRQYSDITEKNTALRHEIAERRRMEVALKQAQDDLEQRVEDRTRALVEEIAERKRAEDEVRRQRAELSHFGRLSIMGEMATSLAHEINQPLTVISGCAQICLARVRSTHARPEDSLSSLEQIAEQAERANQIIRRMRGFLQKREHDREPLEVNEAIRKVSDLLGSDAREHASAVELDLADDLPPVMADLIQIQQVILNLAHNGFEAMSSLPPAQRRLTIQTWPRQGGAVEVVVRDRGEGLSAKSLDRIFDPFFTTKSQGLGMGLPISRSIVEAHGGRLWATSDGETGSGFHFLLPPGDQGEGGDP